MKEVSLGEAKNIMLTILDDVSSFCDKHQLKYYIAYGTLIGAIRHKGFIPWDDDIDIEMPRPDYEKFIMLYKNEGTYSIGSPLSKNGLFFHTKIYDNRTIKYEDGIDYSSFSPYGIDIDVFPLDGQPNQENFQKFKKIINKAIIIHSFITRAIRPRNKGSLKNRLVSNICRCIGKTKFMKMYINNATTYDYEKSEFVGLIDPYSKYSNRHKKELLKERIKVEFEGKTYWAPKGYDEYLQNLYGDYMKLPPLEQQKSHHKYKLYWKE